MVSGLFLVVITLTPIVTSTDNSTTSITTWTSTAWPTFDPTSNPTMSVPLDPSNGNATHSFYVVSEYDHDIKGRRISCDTPFCRITCDVEYYWPFHLALDVTSTASEVFTIECLEDYSCLGLTVSASQSTSVHIHCVGNSSCEDSSYHLKNVGDVVVSCDGETGTTMRATGTNMIWMAQRTSP